jgi:hypothetical protein
MARCFFSFEVIIHDMAVAPYLCIPQPLTNFGGRENARRASSFYNPADPF